MFAEGLDPESVNDTGDTLMLFACRRNRPQIVELCLDNHCRNDPHPDWGHTALHIAVKLRHYECMTALLEKAAAHQFAQKVISIRCAGEYSRCALHMAASQLALKSLKLLTSYTSNVWQKDCHGQTALHVLCHTVAYSTDGPLVSKQEGKSRAVLACASLLLSFQGAKHVNTQDDSGKTALHYGVKGGKKLTLLLLNHGADPRLKDNAGVTPFNSATKKIQAAIKIHTHEQFESNSSSSGSDWDEPHTVLSRKIKKSNREMNKSSHRLYKNKAPTIKEYKRHPVSSPQQEEIWYRNWYVDADGEQFPWYENATTGEQRWEHPTAKAKTESTKKLIFSPDSTSHTVPPAENHLPLVTSDCMYDNSYIAPDGVQYFWDEYNQWWYYWSEADQQNVWFQCENLIDDATSWNLNAFGVGNRPQTPPLGNLVKPSTPPLEGLSQGVGKNPCVFKDVSVPESRSHERNDHHEGYMQRQSLNMASVGSINHQEIRGQYTGQNDVSGQSQAHTKSFTESQPPSGKESSLSSHGCNYETGDKTGNFGDTCDQDADKKPHSHLPENRGRGNGSSGEKVNCRKQLPVDDTNVIDNDSGKTDNSYRGHKSSLQSPKEHSSTGTTTSFKDAEEATAAQSNFGHSIANEANLSTKSAAEEDKETDSLLTDLSKYFSMVKIGIPIEAVQQKMTKDQYSAEDIERFAEQAHEYQCAQQEKNDTENEDARPAERDWKIQYPALFYSASYKYLKMRSMNIPAGSVEQKMIFDGELDVNQRQSFTMQLEGFLSVHGKPALKLLINRVEELQETQPQTDSKTTCAKISTNAKPKAGRTAYPDMQTRETLKNELEASEDMDKYLKMQKMNVPLGAVRGKMIQDGVEKSLIRKFIFAYAQDEAEAESLGALQELEPPTGPRSEADAAAAHRRSKIPLVKLHWNAIPEEKLAQSVWATARDESVIDEELDWEDLEVLQNVFASKQGKKVVKSGSGPATKRAPGKVDVIDMKRRNNVSISLAQFKKVGTFEDVLGALHRMELSVDQSETLLELLPSNEEMSKIERIPSGNHEWPEVETWFYTCMKVPRLERKVTAAISYLRFDSMYDDLQERANVLEKATSSILYSEALRNILNSALTIGNKLNEGSNKASAQGFTLESLNKLFTTKGNDKKTTVLDFVVRTTHKKDETVVPQLLKDLATLKDVQKVSLTDVQSDLKALLNKLISSAKEANQERSDLCEMDSKSNVNESGSNANPQASIPENNCGKAEVPANPLLASIQNAGKLKKGKSSAAKYDNNIHKRNPCKCEDRAYFVEMLDKFGIAAQEKCTHLESKVENVESASEKVILYFAEDPSIVPVEQVFDTLREFCVSCEASLQKLKRETLRVPSAPQTPGRKLPPVIPPTVNKKTKK